MKHGEISSFALQFRRRSHALVQSLFCLFPIPIFWGITFCGITLGQTEVAQYASASSVVISWTPRPGVKRYRLQIARDSSFADVLYDGLVTGSRYSTAVPGPGVYYWRVA